MNYETAAELYLSFAGVFQRPRAEVIDHFEEFIELWEEELPVSAKEIMSLKKFCSDFPAGEERVNALWEHYIPLFETGNVEAPPYASVYLNDNGLVMGEETYAVKDFYELAGYQMGESSQVLPDHLAVELEFMALLARDNKVDILESFRKTHLLPFLQTILPKIQETNRPVYSVSAKLLFDWQL